MKIVSWNVNGIRAAMKKGFTDSVMSLEADIVCLQETKAHPEQVDLKMGASGYEYEYWNSAERKGYSGVAMFSRAEPLAISRGIGHPSTKKGGF